MCGQELLDGPKCLASEFASDGVGARGIRIDYPEQADSLALQFQFLVDSGVVAPKNAYAHHGDGDRIVRCQKDFSLGRLPEPKL
jgi:hypothetical protein